VAKTMSNLRRRRVHGRSARGMTLLELLLVMSLLVMLGAIVAPSFQATFEMQRVRQGGELVRIAFNKARIAAMKSGQIQMFRYTAETGTYQVMPYFSQQDWLEADAAHAVGGALSGVNQQLTNATQASDAQRSQPRELPEGVVFGQSDVETDLRSYEIQQQLRGQGTTGALEAPPVLFYPDGTTSDARIILTNESRRLYVLVTLRSLTGIATVSKLLNADELQQQP
jgi:prepilin-type N-terminal cleavage/methylation domain-containing protein